MSASPKSAVNPHVVSPTPTVNLVAEIPPSLTTPSRHLCVEELEAIRQAINPPPPGESPTPKQSFFWPPRSYQDGLLKDVVTSRCKAQYKYFATSTLYNFCLALQLILGASLTGLGTSANRSQNGLPITILAAANTVNAGIIAILHNTGIPNRIYNDWKQFEKVEMELKELVLSGTIPDQMNKIDIIDSCWKDYTTAKATVASNKPSSYTADAAIAFSTNPTTAAIPHATTPQSTSPAAAPRTYTG